MWCGIFLSKRNHYVLTGDRPPKWWVRSLIYVIIPMVWSVFIDSNMSFVLWLVYLIVVQYRAIYI
jgi:hypothetical protein